MKNLAELERLRVHLDGLGELTEFGVTGSRKWNPKTTRDVSRPLSLLGSQFSSLTMHNGGADGLDKLAGFIWDHAYGKVLWHRPNTAIPSPQRYHIRNQEIVDRSELMLVFLAGPSKGTRATWRYAETKNVPCFVFQDEE